MNLNNRSNVSRSSAKSSGNKWKWIGPMILAGIVILVVGGLVRTIYNHSYRLVEDELKGDAHQAVSSVAFRLDNERDYLLLLAEEMARGVLNEELFQERASRFVADHPGLINITWADEDFVIRWTAPYEPNKQVVGLKLSLPEPERASRKAYETKQPVYTGPFEVIQGKPAFEVYVPVFRGDRFLGTFGGIYCIIGVLRHNIPQALHQNYQIAFIGESGDVIWGMPPLTSIDRRLSRMVQLDPPGYGVSLLLKRYHWELWPWWVWGLIILSGALAIGMAWGMIALRRDVGKRVSYEKTLKEVNKQLQASISDKEQAEEKIRGQNEFLQTILDSLTHPFFVINAEDYTIDLANSAAVTEALPENITCYAFTHKRDKPCDFPGHACPVKVIKKTKKPFTTEHVHYDKDGNEEYSEVYGYPIFDKEGKVVKVIEYSLDISKRKRWEQERDRLADQLRQAQKMEAIGTLAGGIAHEFNNILGAIIGFAELAEDDIPPDTTANKNLRQVLVAATRAKEMVRQILAFSRKDEIERKPVLLTEIVKEAITLLRSTLPSFIDIHSDIEEKKTLPPILANPTEIQQVIMNLCTNAAYAMKESGGLLIITLDEIDVNSTALGSETPDHSNFQRLTVSDTGCGMTPEIKARIFDPYFTTKAQGEGTGMGLAVVHGIVKRHGGEITVESEPEKGTTFHVLLPATENEPLPSVQEIKPVEKGNERILYVDDEQLLSEMGKQMLGKLGYRVEAHTCSVEALEQFKQRPDDFDLVITDQTMPEMTGIQFAGKLRKIRPGIPIILCTGFSESIDEKNYKSMGIDGFVMKPVVKNEIARVIRETLDTANPVDNIDNTDPTDSVDSI
jgi:signal transduction histidine kinase/ActR/RegA family two-component response regulator